jgi:hypothetical protein
MDTSLRRATRTAALFAGPLAGLSLIAAIAAEVLSTSGAMEMSVLAPVGGVAGMAAAIALLLGTLGLHEEIRDDLDGRGAVPLVVIVAGCALVTGAMWSMAFVVPGLASVAPATLDEPMTSVVAGFVVSHAVLGIGALCWAVIAGRAGALTKGMSRLLIAGALLCLTPLPTRFLLLSVGITLATRQLSAAPIARPVTA